MECCSQINSSIWFSASSSFRLFNIVITFIAPPAEINTFFLLRYCATIQTKTTSLHSIYNVNSKLPSHYWIGWKKPNFFLLPSEIRITPLSHSKGKRFLLMIDLLFWMGSAAVHRGKCLLCLFIKLALHKNRKYLRGNKEWNFI